MTTHSRHLAVTLWKSWLPLAFGLTVTIGFVHLAVQQSYRQDAYDPQIELVESVGAALSSGVKATDLLGEAPPTDIAKTLTTFLAVVDKDDKLVASNAKLNGQSPVMPSGLLVAARQGATERSTWEPQAGVRQAVVALAVPNGDGQVVVVGRSLREVDLRISQLTALTLFAWVVAIFGSLAIASLTILMKRKTEASPAKPV